MSNKTQTDGFGWDELWSGFSNQPVTIKREWMLGKINGYANEVPNRSDGLCKILTDVMKTASQRVKDEVFEFAPDDVKKYFGYTTQTPTLDNFRSLFGRGLLD
jgi:hypothetical protein